MSVKVKPEVPYESSLQYKNPGLAKEWHPEKNGDVTPSDVWAGTGKKVWWICEKGHEWQAVIASRNNGGHGCPYCSNPPRKITKETSLAWKYPELVKEWHKEKNGALLPEKIAAGSGKKVWWKCKNGHEWQQRPNMRTRGVGCPYCSGQKVCKDNCFATKYPEIAKEWHPEKNGDITPTDVTPGTSKPYWWKCKKGHEWRTSVSNRTCLGRNCPYCGKRYVTKETSLATRRPDLAKEWHPEKNGKLTPEDVRAYAQKKVWWKCKKGHEWQSTVSNRNQGKNCPYCGHKKVCIETSLATVNPEIAKEWHPEKNGKLTPEDFFPNSHKMAWWKCGNGHEWCAIIADRHNNGGKCPFCKTKYKGVTKKSKTEENKTPAIKEQTKQEPKPKRRLSIFGIKLPF
ncbi:MAG: zinc-ribbon domain-containing protein [Spirochaetales bacterium]|nr:zinc-ribbon domain-containing protein [Spirochaetales bacterium]